MKPFHIFLTVMIGLAAVQARADDLTLWYRQPAANWNEALPVGNGRLGGMIFGGIENELIQLNEDSVWAGQRYAIERPEVKQNLAAVRALIFAGQYAEAQALVEKAMTTRPDPRYGAYQPLGDLKLTFPGIGGKPTCYRRELNLDRAVARTVFTSGGVRYAREVFASAPAQVMVIRLTCNEPRRISLKVDLTRTTGAMTHADGNDTLILSGRCPEGGSVFRAYVKALTSGGKVLTDGRSLAIESADEATLLIAANTDFLQSDPDARCRAQLARAAASPVDALLKNHLANYQSLFRRVTLDLGRNEAASLPTDERLRRVKAGQSDPQLAALHFQFGRYLLIASSRPGGLPANLQGLWNPLFKPPWFSDYTININTEMNYWPAEVANLSECHEPLFDLIERLRAPARHIARERYGCGGSTLSTRTTPWGATDLRGSAGLLWQDGMAWLSLHLWEHYAFTLDRDFLARRAWPVMKEAAQFYLDFMVEHPQHHWLVAGPATSPENNYLTADGKKVAVDMGPAMTMQIIRELFNNTIEAGRLLGRDAEFVKRLEATREKLAPPRIGSDGRLLEWSEEHPEAEPGHRHVSHLFGLYPGHLFTPDATPELAAAARKSLEYRLAHGGGHTGWSRAWLICFWARLREGDEALKNIEALLAQSTLPNLFDNHPPFQIDGNFGATAAIAEMLLQSRPGEVNLLPALPKAWRDGSVKGLRARGSFVVDMSWQGGQLTEATIHSLRGGVCLIRQGGRTIQRSTQSGESYHLKGSDLLEDGTKRSNMRKGSNE